MALEEEIRDMFRRGNLASSPKATEALITGEPVQVNSGDLFTILMARFDTMERAVLRVANEVDQLRS